MTSFTQTDFTHCSSVFIDDFEQVIVFWECFLRHYEMLRKKKMNIGNTNKFNDCIAHN